MTLKSTEARDRQGSVNFDFLIDWLFMGLILGAGMIMLLLAFR
jgi:hypothetical protein